MWFLFFNNLTQVTLLVSQDKQAGVFWYRLDGIGDQKSFFNTSFFNTTSLTRKN